MKVKYLAALAAASVLGVTTLVSCGPAEVEPDASGDVIAPDAVAPDDTIEVDPCAAADPCAADPCAAE